MIRQFVSDVLAALVWVSGIGTVVLAASMIFPGFLTRELSRGDLDEAVESVKMRNETIIIALEVKWLIRDLKAENEKRTREIKQLLERVRTVSHRMATTKP